MSLRCSVTIVIALAAFLLVCPRFSDSAFGVSERVDGPVAAETDKREANLQDSGEVSEEPASKIVRGRRERRLSRKEKWIEGLEGDRKRIYQKYGSPPTRYREEAMGTVIEKWVYPDAGKTFAFRGNNLVYGH